MLRQVSALNEHRRLIGKAVIERSIDNLQAGSHQKYLLLVKCSLYLTVPRMHCNMKHVVFVAALVLLALGLLTPLFQYIPTSALSCVIIIAVLDMVNFQMVANLWRVKSKWTRSTAVSIKAFRESIGIRWIWIVNYNYYYAYRDKIINVSYQCKRNYTIWNYYLCSKQILIHSLL